MLQIMNVHFANEQEKLLHDIGVLDFVVIELALYLDTHPADSQAMEYYQYVKRASQNAVSAYEQTYGPLMSSQVNDNTWTWINGPWPWEGGN